VKRAGVLDAFLLLLAVIGLLRREPARPVPVVVAPAPTPTPSAIPVPPTPAPAALPAKAVGGSLRGTIERPHADELIGGVKLDALGSMQGPPGGPDRVETFEKEAEELVHPDGTFRITGLKPGSKMGVKSYLPCQLIPRCSSG
jgi:hypothetical protein